MSLPLSLRAELLKTKRTASFYFTLVGAAVIPVTFILNFLMDGVMDHAINDPLNSIFKLHAEMNGLVIFPMFVVLICTLLPQLEYRNNTWKQVLSSPQEKKNIFLAKFLNIHLLMLLFLIATHVFLLVPVVMAHFMQPELNLLGRPLDGYTVWLRAGNSYVLGLALSALQFWLGMRFRNFIVPIAIGLGCWLVGTLMVFEFKSSVAPYFPYSYQAFSMSKQYQPLLAQAGWTSLGYAIAFLVLGFIEFRRRRFVG